MSVDKLYIKPVGGLCNRLRAIGSATIIAAQSHKKLVVFWGRDAYLNCKFSDLFAPSTYFEVIEEKQWMGKKALFPYLPGSKPTSFFRKSLNKITCQTLGIQQQIWFEDFEETVAPLVKNVNPISIKSMKAFETCSFDKLKQLIKPISTPGSAFICTAWKLAPWQNYKDFFIPIPEIQDKINAISLDFDHTIGVHIRRSDHASAIAFSQLHKFESAMQNELDKAPATNFFLATDCFQSECQLKDKFGDKVRIFKKSTLDRNSPIGIQEGLIDLYTLARTKKLLGSYFSSFSQVAAEISGIKEDTII